MFGYGHSIMQRSFDDLGTPLADVTFCVIDLETTGGSALTCAITEIGAVKVRGGECLGTFHTLVNPGLLIPPEITILTGITQSMVFPAPRIESVLPTLVEFMDGAVVVGHNVRFDVGFLNAAFERAGWPRISAAVIDTCALARRLVRDEVPNCKLGTLSSRFRLDHQPSHRALDDALATCDLLHLLLERAAAFGVMGSDDLILLPKLGGHPQVAKLKLTNHLPRTPGVYLFTGNSDEVLYVGKATNLRSRVRSYFSSDDRRKIGSLLREVSGVRHIECANTLEAAVTEIRLIHDLQPRYNRQIKLWKRYAYVKLTLTEAFPRLAVVRACAVDGNLYLGPLPSSAAAQSVVDAIHGALPLRRCTVRLGRRTSIVRDAPCTAGQLGVAACPCAGTIDQPSYAKLVRQVVNGLTGDHEVLLGPLRERMHALASDERFEEAADVRDRAGALAGALRRQHRIDSLRRSGRIRVSLAGGGGVDLCDGVFLRAWPAPLPGELSFEPGVLDRGCAAPVEGPVPRHLADEISCIAGWLEQEARGIRIEHCDGALAVPTCPVASFQPASRPTVRPPGSRAAMGKAT